jgi:hypothetical protein
MIRRDHYSSNNFQESTKIKIIEKKTLGYLPRVLFFNAFELGVKVEIKCFRVKKCRRVVDGTRSILVRGE